MGANRAVDFFTLTSQPLLHTLVLLACKYNVLHAYMDQAFRFNRCR